MQLIKNRNFEYKKIKTLQNHPTAECFEITFSGIDNSEIVGDLFLPKSEIKGIFLDFPDFKIAPKDYLNLSRYNIHNYGVFSLHVRGQVGKSSNKQPWSIYAPFLNTDYYEAAYQDAIDAVTFLKKEYHDLPLFATGIGQGASLATVASAITKQIDYLFIANIDNCDFKTIYEENKDVGFYEPLRTYVRNNINAEETMFNKLKQIDVINYASDVTAKVFYGQSQLNVVTPLKAQNKFLNLLENKEIKIYRKFEKEVLQEHFFDEHILKELSKIQKK